MMRFLKNNFSSNQQSDQENDWLKKGKVAFF
jgi:hypothetical protein